MQAGCIQAAFDTEPSTVGGGGDPELDGSSEVVRRGQSHVCELPSHFSHVRIFVALWAIA